MLVFDASAAVKWFRPHEAGSERAIELLIESAETGAWLPDNAVHEVLNHVGRTMGPQAVPEAWSWIRAANVVVAGIDTPMVLEAAAVAREFGCTHYDALAPALARRLGATLVSGDRRAHGRFPGVEIVG